MIWTSPAPYSADLQVILILLSIDKWRVGTRCLFVVSVERSWLHNAAGDLNDEDADLPVNANRLPVKNMAISDINANKAIAAVERLLTGQRARSGAGCFAENCWGCARAWRTRQCAWSCHSPWTSDTVNSGWNLERRGNG